MALGASADELWASFLVESRFFTQKQRSATDTVSDGHAVKCGDRMPAWDSMGHRTAYSVVAGADAGHRHLLG
jgi:hypothetical protein